MNEEFSMYTAKVEELGTTVGDQAKNYIEKIDEVTDIVTVQLASVWGGPTYDTFVAAYNDRRGDIEELYNTLNDIADTLSSTAASGEMMINQIDDQMGV